MKQGPQKNKKSRKSEIDRTQTETKPKKVLTFFSFLWGSSHENRRCTALGISENNGIENGINGISLYNVGFCETGPIKKEKKSKLFEIWFRFIPVFLGLDYIFPTVFHLEYFSIDDHGNVSKYTKGREEK